LGTDMLLPDEHGACSFYDPSTRLCRVHRDHGAISLPRSCFQFPRRALVDDRGVFVTLSHFCPTAAALLVRSSEPATSVEAPPAFPADREYEGLDGRDDWPPLIKADLLFDPGSYSRWERYILDMLAREELLPIEALTILAAAAEDLRAWAPDNGPLERYVSSLDDHHQSEQRLDEVAELYANYRSIDTYERLLTMIPAGLRRPPATGPAIGGQAARLGWPVFAGAVKRYLAAKAFGSWAAYEAFGVRTMMAELTVSELVLRVETARVIHDAQRPLDEELLIAAVRASDWLLMHLVDRPSLMKWLGGIERSVPR
jgi:hypothetical protein